MKPCLTFTFSRLFGQWNIPHVMGRRDDSSASDPLSLKRNCHGKRHIQKSNGVFFCKNMCCRVVYDCLLHTDSIPCFLRGRLLAKKPLNINLGKNFLHFQPWACPLFPRLCTNPLSQLCSFANCTHVTLHNISTSVQSHAQAARPDGGQGGHGQLPRNPGNLLLRPPVSALG